MHATPPRRLRLSAPATLGLVCAAALTLSLAACGGSDSGSGAKIATGTAIAKGQKGGTVTMLTTGDVDYIDPGQTYYQFGYQVLYATQRPLYSYKPDATSATPDLASGPPEVADDNKSITVHLRKGIHYSPPIADREVTSADVKYAFERAFTKQVPSGYASTYFGTLVGAPKEPNSGDYAPISGIVTPDPQTIEFHFSKPVAGFLAGALALPLSVPVPKSYAEPFDKKTPSTYEQHVVFTGPYMVRSNAQGKLVGHKPGKSIELVRNPSWDKTTGDYRPAYLDKVEIQEGNTDDVVSSRRTLKTRNTLCCDSAAPPAQILRLASTRYPKQIQKVDSGGTHWIALNTTLKPLDNVNIRRAMVAITNRQAIRQVVGGPIVGPIATGVIPPGLPGFEEAGGLKQGGGADFLSNEAGDAAVAKKYMLAAKADGESVSADGKYTGGEELAMVPANTPQQLKEALIIQSGFQKLGLKVKIHQVPQDAVYTKFCGVPKAKVAICSSVGWVKDFQDPETLFDPTFDGNNILAQGNTNWSQLDDPAINAAMEKARFLPNGKARNNAWAAINNQVDALAPIVPLFWDSNININGPGLHLVESRFMGSPDFDYMWVDG
jgi:peptide/nickel transport system substrate-binding protein